MNCIIVDDDDASISVFKKLAKQVDYLTIVQTCSNSMEAIDVLKKGNVDVLFLDIEMPGMSGIDMLKALDSRPQVVLTTSHKEYALDAFELNVVDYLIKPVTLSGLLKAMAKVKDHVALKDPIKIEPDYFFVKKDSVLIKVPVKDILWIEALGDYITLQTKEHRFIIHITLKSVEDKLSANKFVRVHRSYIIQLDNISSVEENTIYINKTSIPIGALYKENFIKRLNTLQ